MISYGYYLHYSYEGIYIYCSWSDLVAQIVARIGSEIGTAFRASFLRNLRFSIFSEPVPTALEGALRAVALLNIGIMPHIR